MTYEEVAKKYLTTFELRQWYANHDDDWDSITTICGLHNEDIIRLTFDWEDSPQGHEYWYYIFRRVERGVIPKRILVPPRYIIKHSIL